MTASTAPTESRHRTPPPSDRTSPVGGRRRLPLAAAIAYVGAWTAGLSVNSTSTQVRDSGQQVIEALRGHRTAATVQYLLTEGATTVLLVLAVWPVWRTCRQPGIRAVLLAATAGAAAVSFVEAGLGMRLAGGRLDAGTAATINDAINRLDGVKMLLLAAAFGGATVAVRRGHLMASRWSGLLTGFATLTLVLSGIGYVTLAPALAAAAWISLPALIAAVIGVGVGALSRTAGSRYGCA